jgi:ABC-type uncharacterized transport system YnjBCD permease subunit
VHIYCGGEEGHLREVFVFGERHERAMKVAVSSLYLSLEESACVVLARALLLQGVKLFRLHVNRAGMGYSDVWCELNVLWCSQLCLTSRMLTVFREAVCSVDVVCERYHQTGFPE